MPIGNLGTLEYVNPRDVWENEPRDFTPWLAANLEKLGETIGVELELVNTEMAVGNYRSDIVAQIPYDGTPVLIENQLGDADLQHLGQVLAYLAGLNAKIVVWVATEFRSELLAAIRWLNEHTPDPYEFFAIEVRIARIGNSLPAPVFDVVERPNRWEREVQSRIAPQKINEFNELKRKFWQYYSERFSDQDDIVIDDRAWDFVHWPAADDLRVCIGITQRSVAVYLQAPDFEDEDVPANMESYQDTINEILVDEHIHLRQYHNQWCKTILRIDTKDRHNWNAMADWLEERRKVYLSVVGPD